MWRKLICPSSSDEEESGNEGKSHLPSLSIYDQMLIGNKNITGSSLQRSLESNAPGVLTTTNKRRYSKYLCDDTSSSDEETSPPAEPTRVSPVLSTPTSPSPGPPKRSKVSLGDLMRSSDVSLADTYASLFNTPPPATASTPMNASSNMEEDEWMDSAPIVNRSSLSVNSITSTNSSPRLGILHTRRERTTPNSKTSKTATPTSRSIPSAPSESPADDATCKPQLPLPARRREVDISLPSTNAVIAASAVPPSAARYLFDHQVSGVQWLWNKYTTGEGAILGDDMGLGKSVQVSCLLLAMYHKNGSVDDKHVNRVTVRDGLHSSNNNCQYPALIVAPASVLENWRRELTTWGYFVVEVLGSKYTAEESIEAALEGKCEVLLMSYAKMTTHGTSLAAVQWSVIIWDEGHQLKGELTKSYLAAYSMRKAQCRFILSGTPIQNNLEELWSLLNLITQGKFHDKKTFKQHFSDPIKRSQQRSASDIAIELGEKRQKELKKLVDKYILQRTKDDVFEDELLGKDDVRVFCELTPLQKDLYAYLFTLPDFDNVRQHNTLCPACDSNKKRGRCCQKKYIIPLDRETGEIDGRSVIWRRNHAEDEMCDACPTCVAMPVMTILGAVASHPLLLQANPYEQDEEEYNMRLEFATKALSKPLLAALGGPISSGEGMVASRMEMSGKMKTLDVLLRTFSQRMEKTLIFSESTRVLSLIEDYIKSQGWRYCRLDGTTATPKRQQLVDKFNNDRGILAFLISTRAGGLGLNLTSATNVILYDVTWNPSLDAQAQDRCYRYGQLQKVTVYRLIAQGTIEELKYMRQLYKQAMQRVALGDNVIGETGRRFEGIQGDKSARGELFGLENLLQYEDGSILLKLRDKYSDKHVMEAGAVCDMQTKKKRELSGLSLCTEGELTSAITKAIENSDV